MIRTREVTVRNRTLWVSIAAMAVGAVGGYAVVGRLFAESAIGLDASAFPAGEWIQGILARFFPKLGFALAGLVVALATLLALGALAFFAARASARATVAATDPGRRSFLSGAASGAGAALGTIAAGAALGSARAFLGLGNQGRGWARVGDEIFGAQVEKTSPSPREEWKGARIQKLRRLGRTEHAVSDIVLGTGPLQGDKGFEIVRLAIDRGVNYIDTAPDYSATGSEEAVGRALAGQRDQVFLATKFCTPVGHLPAGTPVATYKETLEGSLRRLGTDHVDLVHVHSCDEIDRLMDENLHTAVEQLRREGKMRFLGFSSHTPNLVDVANRAIDSGKFDVMMLAYHHGIWSQLPEIIERAVRAQDMGIIAMKTLKGARHHGLAGFREHAEAYSQAALKWTLSNPNVSAAVISFSELQHVDEYLFASGAPLSPHDTAILERYDREIFGSYCAPHCGACLDHCPEQLPIHDVLRFRMYFEDYGWEKEAMGQYARLGRNASVCAGCSAPCLGACPVGVSIPDRMRGAHELLRLA
jgi:hypothetical protein